MAEYLVDFSGHILVDAGNMDDAADLAYEHLAGVLEYFRITGVNEDVIPDFDTIGVENA